MLYIDHVINARAIDFHLSISNQFFPLEVPHELLHFTGLNFPIQYSHVQAACRDIVGIRRL